MSGPIVDDPIRICTGCGQIYLEDPVLDEDPDICPNCGMAADADGIHDGISDDLDYGSTGAVPGIDYAEAGEAEAGDKISKVI